MLKYPTTRRAEVREHWAGVTFADPYRWLEGSSDEVRRWQQKQAELASNHVRSWPHFDALKRSVARFHTAPQMALPRYAGGLWFRVGERHGTAPAKVIVAKAAIGAGRVLFDPKTENPESPPFVLWIAPSPDGRTLALGACGDGSENNTIRIIDVATGHSLPAPAQVLMDSWLGGVYWLPDSSGFFYTALCSSTSEFRQAVYLHRLGASPPSASEEIPFPEGSREYRGVMISPCGRWAVAMHRILAPIPVAVRDLGDPTSSWRPFITDIADKVAGHVISEAYVAVTTLNAPRGRVVRIPLDSPAPNDPTTWKEIIPESPAVIRNVTVIGQQLYVTELVDTYARVRMFQADGSFVGEVSLPGRGAVAEMPFPLMEHFAKRPSESFVFAFSSLTESWGIYSHRPGDAHTETLIPPDVRIEAAVVEDRWANSSNRVRVPYHIVRRADVDMDRPQPTLLFAYGSGGAAVSPQFPGAMAAFVAAGGVFVHAHPRGGGELGLDWWHGGVLQNRQNSYADMYAVAEDLIARGVTAPKCLALTGRSAGGLMVGVAVTQRPELWRVVIPQVPVLDVIGGAREPYLAYVASLEFGDFADPEEVRRMGTFSPYQLVRDGVEYPAVYIDAGDADPRCPAWHARKFAARLQEAQAGLAPILLHVWENSGHGWATAKDVQIQEYTEWLAFAMQELGMKPEAIVCEASE